MAAWEDHLSDGSTPGTLSMSLLPDSPQPGSLSGRQALVQAIDRLRREVQHSYTATTDEAFIRSEVNGRRSRRIVLVAFFFTDVIGATLWATWCQTWWGHAAGSMDQDEAIAEQVRACESLGMNHFVLLSFSVPVEGLMLFLAGRNPWSFWSDGWLLPVWLIRLTLFDVLVWKVPPQTLVVDALWFSVMAVMCRVHSLALAILVVTQVVSLIVVFRWHGALILDDLDHVRYGIYSISMLLIMAFAYALDEQSRLQSFTQLMSLQDENAALADRMLRWKVLPGGSPSEPEELDLSPSRFFRVPNVVSNIAAGAWNRLATPPEAILQKGPGARLTTVEVDRRPQDEAHANDDHSELSYPGEGALAGEAGGGSVRRPGHVVKRRNSGEQRSVRFSLPQAKSSEKHSTVRTQKPSVGIALSARPHADLDLLDVME